ncbi:threonine aldolase [Candidatus Epulonipiscioides gigas]|nr:threonine aldolase [Epulopiscium sp. SCG-C07WGA-EpuloA2]
MFRNDYSVGAHPYIIDEISKTNAIHTRGYGEDKFCEKAISLIKEHLQNEFVDIHFFVGGTQTNMTALSAFLRPHEGIISADTGHINLHETGAIEATGHTIIPVENKDGKISACQIQKVIDNHMPIHMTKPRLVYISNSTEYGTIYSKAELYAISDICKKNNLLLYIDGARLGVALTCEKNDLTMIDICNCVDAFYIGGTKNGAMFGEALVILNENLKEDFKYFIKQRGALLAKGRFLGIQFIKLFEHNLFYDLAQHANKMASQLSNGLEKLGFNLFIKTETNQIFVILTNEQHKKLSQIFDYEVWEPHEKGMVVRFVTSWATHLGDVEHLLKEIEKL